MSHKDYEKRFKANDEVEEVVESTEEVMEEMSSVGEVVNCNLLNVRANPSTDGIVIGELLCGSKVAIESFENDEWVKIEFNGNNAYVMRKYISC